MSKTKSNLKSLIQEFDTGFKSLTELSNVAPRSPIIEINSVKKIVEAYEMKHNNVMYLSNNRQPDTRVASVNNIRRKEYKKYDDNFGKTIKMSEKMKRTLGDLSPVDERPSNEKKEMKEVTRMLSNCATIDNVDNVEKDNVQTVVSSTSKIFTEPTTRDSARNAKDDYAMLNSSPSKNSQVTIMHKCRKFFGKVKRRDCKNVERRLWPRCQRDEWWYMKRKGCTFFTSLLNIEHLLKYEFENVANVSTCSNNLESAAMNNSQDYDNDNILATLDTLDDSGNSYKNLQVDVFDFENEEPHQETQKTKVEFVWNQQTEDDTDDDMEIIDLNHSSLESSNETAVLDVSLNETVVTLLGNKNETDILESTYNIESVPESSSLIDIESMKVVDVKDSKQPNENKKMIRMPSLRKRFSYKKILKKLLYICKPKRYVEETSENDVNKEEENDHQISQESHHLLSSDSGFIEYDQSSNFSANSSLNISDQMTSNCRIFNRNGRYNNMNRWKRRAVKKKISCNELAHSGSSCQSPQLQTKKLHCEHPKCHDENIEKSSKNDAIAVCSSGSNIPFVRHVEHRRPLSALENHFFSSRETDNIIRKKEVIGRASSDESELQSWHTDLSTDWKISSPYRIRD